MTPEKPNSKNSDTLVYSEPPTREQMQRMGVESDLAKEIRDSVRPEYKKARDYFINLRLGQKADIEMLLQTCPAITNIITDLENPNLSVFSFRVLKRAFTQEFGDDNYDTDRHYDPEWILEINKDKENGKISISKEART